VVVACVPSAGVVVACVSWDEVVADVAGEACWLEVVGCSDEVAADAAGEACWLEVVGCSGGVLDAVWVVVLLAGAPEYVTSLATM
jgi:hypothetical protein